MFKYFVNLLNKKISVMAKKKIQPLDQEKIVSFYTDYVLTNGKKPHSVYEFSKNNGFEESDFYTFFASFEALEENFFSNMFHYTKELVVNSPDYAVYNASQKLSCFYFTFFEVATANRSFVVYLLKQEKMPLKNLMKLKQLRKEFLSYVKTVLETPYKIENQKIRPIERTTFANQSLKERSNLQRMLKEQIDIISPDTLIVAEGADHPMLYAQGLICNAMHWLTQEEIELPFTGYAKIRYRQTEQACVVSPLDNQKHYILFSTPQRAVTPGQYLVLYDKNRCLGGAIIEQIIR